MMQGICIFMAGITMLTTPVFLLVWLRRQKKDKPVGRAAKATAASAICFVVFLLGATLTSLEEVEPSAPEPEDAVAEAPEIEAEEEIEFEPEPEEEDTTTVSDGAQMVLSMIAEDMAKQIASNPGTVKMDIFSQGFYRDGHLYAVHSNFTCANAFGVEGEHTIKVVALSNEDESKISPIELYLDDKLIWVRDE